MGVNHVSREKSSDNHNNISHDKLENIKSKYILSKIIDIMPKKKKLEIVGYNKKIQVNMVNLLILMKIINYIIIYILMIIKKK